MVRPVPELGSPTGGPAHVRLLLQLSRLSVARSEPVCLSASLSVQPACLVRKSVSFCICCICSVLNALLHLAPPLLAISLWLAQNPGCVACGKWHVACCQCCCTALYCKCAPLLPFCSTTTAAPMCGASIAQL